MHSPCIHTFFSIYLLYLNFFGTFLIVFLSLPLFLFMLVVFMAPKHKSTPSQNPLRSKTSSSSSDPTPSHIRLHDEDTRKDFSENFSRRGVHSECRVILVDFTDTDLPTHSQSEMEVTVWRLGHLSDHADPGVLLQHAWFWFFNTFLFYSCSRYVHCSHTTTCCRCASCSKGRASWLSWLWVSTDCVQRRDDFRFLWASRILRWSSIQTM